MLKLVYDTETTGLPLWSEPSEDPRQPHLAQLAAALVDTETRKIVQSIDLIIRPEGWEIPDDVAAVHGITTEHALEVGISEETALKMLLDLWRFRPRIAHNESFDCRIIRIGIKRYFGNELADAWKEAEAECTCKLATPIVNLPPTPKMLRAGRKHAKTANLGEAYEFFTGQPLEDAHSAMADVLGCLAVYWAIQDRNAPPDDMALTG